MNRRNFMKWLGFGAIAPVLALPVSSIASDIPKALPVNKTNANRIQLLMQLHDKQLISSHTLIKEMDMNYDEEVEKIRREQEWWFKSRNIA